MGKKEFALSRRELDVMNVLWAEGKPLIASEIPERRPELSINTVHAVLKKLLKRGFIEVAQIVQSGTVLSRSYTPTITSEEYAKNTENLTNTQNTSVDKAVRRTYKQLFGDDK